MKNCFGSKFVNAKEIENFYYDVFLYSDKNKKYIYNELLLIALFDIWLSNEDRNFNNTNLLIDINKKFIPIDHTQIFNGNAINRKPYTISSNETILSTYFTKKLFTKKYFIENFNNIFDFVKNKFYFYSKKCEKQTDEIFKKIPNDWQLNETFLKKHLNYYFSDTWKQEVLKKFKEFLFHIYK